MSKTTFGLSHKLEEEIYLERILKSCSEEEAVKLCKKRQNDLRMFFNDSTHLDMIIALYSSTVERLEESLTLYDRRYKK